MFLYVALYELLQLYCFLIFSAKRLNLHFLIVILCKLVHHIKYCFQENQTIYHSFKYCISFGILKIWMVRKYLHVYTIHLSNALMCRMMAYDFEVFHVFKSKLPVYVFLGKVFLWVEDVFSFILIVIATNNFFSFHPINESKLIEVSAVNFIPRHVLQST